VQHRGSGLFAIVNALSMRRGAPVYAMLQKAILYLKQTMRSQISSVRPLSNVDASVGAGFGRLVGQSVGPAGLQGRPEGRRGRLTLCLNIVNRCCPRQASRWRAAPLRMLLLRRRAPGPTARYRLK
jgi:hypothetical protein